MIILKQLSQLENAQKKANEKKPKLKVLEFGKYAVQGSTGDWYVVSCKKQETGGRIVFCSCEDKFPRKENQPCYHMPVAIGAHMLLCLARDSYVEENNVIQLSNYRRAS